ncbi:MAG: DUF2256 and DUF3253 domain-containing protein, partial [Candidatus Nanopelagicales bacterium]|nr:DUF2256 and DUF3253 domain-containing protein [Candidatus Nanopelagicales bacterium]MCF8556755.1 DUF2256 and DUF3253 domain-containing protein [Candidatus Nanopelagicales bacterium]
MTSGRRTDTKVCWSCGRVMSWRKSWDRNWDEVRYCSKACRRRRVSSADRALEAAIVDLLDQRGGTICPTEAIHLVSSDVDEPARTEQALSEPARR